jgi:hypothetical protein
MAHRKVGHAGFERSDQVANALGRLARRTSAGLKERFERHPNHIGVLPAKLPGGPPESGAKGDGQTNSNLLLHILQCLVMQR